MTRTVDAIYEDHIKSLSVREKLQLVSKITQALLELNSVELNPEPGLLEFESSEANLLKKTAIDKYINELRWEWDES